MSEVILGMNAFHGDSAVCLVVDGKLVAAAEEERFHPPKHWAGFPSEAAKHCLASAVLTLSDVDHVAVNRDPSTNLMSKVPFSRSKGPSPEAIKGRRGPSTPLLVWAFAWTRTHGPCRRRAARRNELERLLSETVLRWPPGDQLFRARGADSEGEKRPLGKGSRQV